MVLPGDYPVHPLSVSLPDDQGIPPTYISHANDVIAEHLETEGGVGGELMFRPFLRWLDGHLSEIFGEAAEEVMSRTVDLPEGPMCAWKVFLSTNGNAYMSWFCPTLAGCSS